MNHATRGAIGGGRYLLVRQIASGGMGTIWEGRDTRLNRTVAIKEVSLDLVAPVLRGEFLERAVHEGRNAAALADHPNIVTVHDVVVEDDAPWTVMQFVRGRSLAEVLSAGPMPVNQAAALAGQLLSALGFAHNAGIVHRDVKPLNIMINDGDGRALLADFGIAKNDQDTGITRTGVIIGSTPYMAPERHEGESGGPPSDLFSLGVTLFEAVEGYSPFAKDSRTGTVTAILAKPLPTMRRAESLAPLIMALTDKDPSSRPSITRASELLHGATSGTNPGTTTLETALGTTGPASVPAAADPIDHAVAIAASIDDAHARANALVWVAAELAVHAPERLAQIEAHLTPSLRGIALLFGVFALADSDPGRALELATQAEPIIAGILDDDLLHVFEFEAAELRAEFSAIVARLAVTCDPRRAGESFDRLVQVLRHLDLDDDKALGQVVEVSKAVGPAAAIDPARAAELMRHVERAAGEIRAAPSDCVWWLPARLAEIARRGRPADPDCAARLQALAVRTALALPKDQDTALRFVAEEVADPDSAEAIIGQISASHGRASAWQGAIIRAAEAGDRTGASRLLDAAERAMLAPTAAAQAEATTAPKLGRLSRIFGATKAGDPQRNTPTPQGPVIGWEMKYLALAALKLDPQRAERIAMKISDLRYRVEALTELVASIAPDKPGQARTWLHTAYQIAVDSGHNEDHLRSPMSLGLIIEAAAVDPLLARAAARDLATALDAAPQNPSIRDLRVQLSGQVAAADPALAVQLVDQIQDGDSVPGYVIKALLAVAAGVANTDPRRAQELVDRAYLEAVRANDERAFSVYLRSAVQDFAQRDPRGARRFAERLEGGTGDTALEDVAEVLAAKDPIHAEKAARAIVDDRQRTAALASLAVAIAESCFENAG